MSDSYKVYASEEYVDDRIMEILFFLELVPCVVDADGAVLSDENGNVILM